MLRTVPVTCEMRFVSKSGRADIPMYVPSIVPSRTTSCIVPTYGTPEGPNSGVKAATYGEKVVSPPLVTARAGAAKHAPAKKAAASTARHRSKRFMPSLWPALLRDR